MLAHSNFGRSRRKFLQHAGAAAAVASLPIGSRLALAAPPTGAEAAGSPSSEHTRVLQIAHRYLNVPISRTALPQLFQIIVEGVVVREFPLQLASRAIDYWIFLDVSDMKGKMIAVSGPATQAALGRIYQADRIHGATSLYKERNRPLFHFTVKRGWNNDVNGPIFLNGQYHLFWQSYPYGVKPDSSFMGWGHAVSADMIHWRELAPALLPDKLGAAWSGTSFIDRNNVGGWGKDALVLVFTARNRTSGKQVQCLAYSTDNGATFTHYAGNPVLDTNSEVGTVQTRDPKVFWHGPSNRWVMVLFEKDGMSFFTSTNLKQWTRQSHFKALHECPDFFELPVDGDAGHKKWVLHGGSSSYFIGSFDGHTFTPESPELRYAEGKNARGADVLYAAQSFAEMPDNRRVQMAWGRITEEGMPFNQMILFPTEFRLKTTKNGIRLRATPIQEIERLHAKKYAWSSLTANDANRKLHRIPPGPLHVKLQLTLQKNDALTIRYQDNPLVSIPCTDLEHGQGSVELLIDKCVAEIFVYGGMRYITKEMPASTNPHGLEFDLGQAGSILNRIEAYPLESMWKSEG